MKQPEILIITSYPNRECGIASFSSDLRNAIMQRAGKIMNVTIGALDNGIVERFYPQEVKFKINALDKKSYVTCAEKINNDEAIQMVFIQHEFGLFGGLYGNFLILMLRKLTKPVCINFHTVLPNPDYDRRNMVRKLSQYANEVIVMTNNAKQQLENYYGIDTRKISVIPHGTHTIIHKEKEVLKEKFGFQGKQLLSTFGLISSNKNIETVLLSLSNVVKIFPEITYLIIGKTHPEVYKNEGESYREYLEHIIEKLQLKNNVVFINRFLETQEILDYLQMSDIYIFSSKDPNQAVSGTFSFAMSAGCPIIATQIPHAKEYLSADEGILIDFENPAQMSQAINHLLANNHLLEQMRINVLHKNANSKWDNVAKQHLDILKPYLTSIQRHYNLPEFTLRHLVRLTHHFGVVQFSKINAPDYRSGYTLDDNARALITCCQYYLKKRDGQLFLLMDKYLRFISYCQQENGSFINYMNEAGEISPQNYEENLEDANGRAIWSLCYLISLRDCLPSGMVTKAKMLFKFALTSIEDMTSLRATSFCLKGFYRYLKTERNSEIELLSYKFSKILFQAYESHKSEDWKWFENKLTYANSILSEGLLYGYLITQNERYKNASKESFDFLLNHMIFSGKVSVIPNKTWFKKGTKRVIQGGEQPIEVAYLILSLSAFETTFPNYIYSAYKELAFSWFMGNNQLGQVVYDSHSGGCHDGIESNNLNLNQGAESTICYLMARLEMQNNITPKRPEQAVQEVQLPRISFYNPLYVNQTPSLP
jgi:glycosyltransferase involved in cell wall biosynthesis